MLPRIVKPSKSSTCVDIYGNLVILTSANFR